MTTVWLTARGAGLAALVLLTLSTVLGTLVSRRRASGTEPKPARRYLVQYLHRAFALLGLTALALHLGTILADPYAHVGWLAALIPFTSAYRPVAVAFGSLALWLLIGVSLLGLARGRMASSPRAARVWRGLHGLAYLGWAAAIWHGFTAGTDSGLPWVRELYAACLVGVLGSITVRLLSRTPVQNHDRFAGRLPIGAAR